MNTLEKIDFFENYKGNDHLVVIGKQLREWYTSTMNGNLTKAELKSHISSSLAGVTDGKVIPSVININAEIEEKLQNLIDDFTALSNS